MKKLIIVTLWTTTGHIFASESGSSSISDPIPVTTDSQYFSQPGLMTFNPLSGSSHTKQNEVRLNMDELEASLAQKPIDHPTLTAPLTNTARLAELLTQIAHGTTSNAPTFLTEHLHAELIKMESENPLKFQHIVEELTQHRTRTVNFIRSRRAVPILDTPHDAMTAPTDQTIDDPAAVGAALQSNPPASAVQLITAAATASNIKQSNINDAQAVTITEARVKFWAVLIAGTVATLSASAVAIIQALGVHV